MILSIVWAEAVKSGYFKITVCKQTWSMTYHYCNLQHYTLEYQVVYLVHTYLGSLGNQSLELT